MRNCFPAPLKPDSWKPEGSVEDEYDEYTLDEIVNGKVCVHDGMSCGIGRLTVAH